MNTAAPRSPGLSGIELVWAALDSLSDPEIPVVTLREMGILRDVRASSTEPGAVEVVITPTYSGCPAMGQIEDDVREVLRRLRVPGRVVTQLAPAWTTDWMSDAAKDKLRAYGIAPPQGRCAGDAASAQDATNVLRFVRGAAQPTPAVTCPHCGSSHTVESSHFGSTACKALYKCLDCQEPFDYFKPY